MDAERLIKFINNLTGTDDFADEPIHLLPFQEEIIRGLFAPGIHKGFIFLPRGQGKTSLLAFLTIAQLYLGPNGQEIISIASDRLQAAKIFDKAAQIIRYDPYLKTQFKISDSYHLIKRKNSYYKALSASEDNKFGGNVSLFIADEVSEWKKRKNWDKMISSMGKRVKSKPLAVAISTANDMDKESLVWELFNKGKNNTDPHQFVYMKYADETENWHDENIWLRCNPAIPHYYSLDFLRAEHAEALLLPTAEHRFRQLYLNTWLDNASAYIRRSDFEKCKAEVELTGEVALGVDLASTQDLSSITALSENWGVKSWSFCPEQAIKERQRQNKERIEHWVDEGWITKAGTQVTDNSIIEEKIAELCATYNVTTVLMDRYNATDLARNLINRGIDVQFPAMTALFLNAPMKELQKLVLCKLLKWDGNPVLAWAVGNCRVIIDKHENFFPSKLKSIDKIDPLIGLLLALAQKMAYVPSIYETMGAAAK